MAEVAGATAHRNDEEIVMQLAIGEDHFSVCQIKVRDRIHDDRDVTMAGQNGTDRLGDIGRGKTCCGDLVKQRLKDMVIGAVNQSDSSALMMKSLAEFQAAKTRAQHNDMS
jgi:hypothetical protein